MINQYNTEQEAAGRSENVITYSDIIETMMKSVTQIINIITYILIAFVAVSLVVSSIMIGIITYISVLERTKGNWYPSCHWCFEERYLPCLQCRDFDYWFILWLAWHRSNTTIVDSY